MTPTITRQAKSTGMKSRQVQAKVPSRFASFPVNAEEQVRQFREARKARETERLEKLRDSRLKNSSAAASTVSASISITSFASSSCPPSKPRVLGVLLNKSQASSTTIKSSALSQRSQPCQRTTHHLTETSSNNNPNAATKCMPALNLPSPLRARLAEWLEKRDHSLDNFKHLKCFGVLGPVVKRPQTPFRKAILSTSTLRAIPESSESTSLNEKVEDTYEEDDIGLNSTFTLEDEDKENICGGFETQMQVQNTTVGNLPLSPNTQRIKDLDQAHGVLSELHRLIKMAYPTEQCGLWLKAIRQRFPQCGEEPIYWECLASLEEIRGDFESAVTCYERAILQGAESCVQSSLDQLHQKMSDLHIEPIPSTNMNNVKRTQNNLPQSKNIIKSSSIQFAVHEKCGSSKKTVIDENKADPVFTATPVRRSMRLAGTPSKGTPGITCVRSLEFLEPKIKNSLIFHGNSALDPNEMKC